MGLSRRFLNLIVEGDVPAIRSLRCIDLKRLQLFYPMTPPSPRPTTPEAMQRLPDRTNIFQACSAHAVNERWNVACYPLAEHKVLCTDQCGRNFLYDGSKREVAVMPEFHQPRLNALYLFIPSGEGEDNREEDGKGEDNRKEDGEGEEDGDRKDDHEEDEEDGEDKEGGGGGGGGSLFLMEKILRPVTGCDIGQPSEDLEVLLYGNGTVTSHCKLLPPPPYVHEPSYWNAPCKIGSYAVVGSGSHVCISVNGRGTYLLDTARHTWNKVGDWTLPFHGKVEYVPELKLWFGLSADARLLAAADLSTMDSQPQLVGGWEVSKQPPEEWMERKDAQLVNLGSGRFCVARFFSQFFEDDDYVENFVILTGLEVVPCVLSTNGNGGNGKPKLEMILHKSGFASKLITMCRLNDSGAGQ